MTVCRLSEADNLPMGPQGDILLGFNIGSQKINETSVPPCFCVSVLSPSVFFAALRLIPAAAPGASAARVTSAANAVSASA
jgi:hypothetical protein